jgi:asparagine synthase (glutamine-hydrolysing)
MRGPLRDWVEGLLAPDALRRTGVLQPEAVRALWAEHLSGGRDHETFLWSILMYQGWRLSA